MLLSRRLLLSRFVGTLAAARASFAISAEQHSGDAFVSSLVDTLVPRDAHPGGLDIGLDNWLKVQAEQYPSIVQVNLSLVTEACERSATEMGADSFASLSLDQRETLLTRLLYGSRARLTDVQVAAQQPLLRIREMVISEYYSRPEGQASAGYQPPWPEGYR